MKHIRILTSVLALAGALLLAGCSSTPAEVDSGALKARTFSFVGGGVPAKAEFADNREQAHALIQKAMTDSLAEKGLAKVPVGGDVSVAYLVVLGNNVATEAINTYFGYGRDASGLEDKAHKAYTGNDNPNYFEAGTLVLDLIDTKSFKLLQRHHVTRPVLRDATAEVREANIREAVTAVMKNVKVAE
jgi:predicted small secreted protein